MKNFIRSSIKIALLNLSIVALLGVLMRYKIGFEFPYLDQKHLLHGHSHFAFAGWLTHILFVLLVVFLHQKSRSDLDLKKYKYLIFANLISAYGMLVCFIWQGYGAFSITFSTLQILIGFYFAWCYIRDLRYVAESHPSKPWFKAALLLNVLSSIGTFYLGYMMMSKNFDQHSYLASVYFYLHFQYSGWFFFACMGLIMDRLYAMDQGRKFGRIFWMFALACIPAYLLSVLWAKLPLYLFALAIVAVVLQLFGLAYFLQVIRMLWAKIMTQWNQTIRYLLFMSLGALVIKLLLQAGSIHPEISKLAYGFRSIVIAYLHLVLLVLLTIFILGYLLLQGHIANTPRVRLGLIIFCTGVFLNELVLMIQGIASFGYILIPYLNQSLFVISACMLIGAVTMLIYHKK
ncbi:MAG: hypothetical protein WAU01_11795 [Saprospiraceae bacterium]